MSTTRGEKGLSFSEVHGKLPAWLWKGIRDSERAAGSEFFPATVVRADGATFLMVEINDWNEFLHRERTADR